MRDLEDEAFDELEKSLQRKVAHGVTDGSKVTIDRAKLEQVLDALEMIDKAMPFPVAKFAQAVIKEALEMK